MRIATPIPVLSYVCDYTVLQGSNRELLRECRLFYRNNRGWNLDFGNLANLNSAKL